MSAFEVGKLHIDALVTAGLKLARRPGPSGPLRWMVAIERHPDYAEAFQPGSPWGPKMDRVYRDSMRELTAETAGQVGAMLAAENRRSVDFRYDETEIEEPYLFTELLGTPDPVIVLAAIACYEYQACETPDWRASEAFVFCAALKELAIRALPAYGHADAWEVHSPDIFRTTAVQKRQAAEEAERQRADAYRAQHAALKAEEARVRRSEAAKKAAATRRANKTSERQS